jgi:hypothetical protein
MKRLLTAALLAVVLCIPIAADANVAWIDWGSQAERHGDVIHLDAIFGRLLMVGDLDHVTVSVMDGCRILGDLYIGSDGRCGIPLPAGHYSVRIAGRRGSRLYHWQQRVYVRQ